MKVSEILWLAANVHLQTDEEYYPEYKNGVYTSYFTCDCVKQAFDNDENRNKTMKLLQEMGVNTCSMREFNEFRSGIQRQGARYAWLMFAHEYALELEAAGEL